MPCTFDYFSFLCLALPCWVFWDDGDEWCIMYVIPRCLQGVLLEENIPFCSDLPMECSAPFSFFFYCSLLMEEVYTPTTTYLEWRRYRSIYLFVSTIFKLPLLYSSFSPYIFLLILWEPALYLVVLPTFLPPPCLVCMHMAGIVSWMPLHTHTHVHLTLPTTLLQCSSWILIRLGCSLLACCAFALYACLPLFVVLVLSPAHLQIACITQTCCLHRFYLQLPCILPLLPSVATTTFYTTCPYHHFLLAFDYPSLLGITLYFPHYVCMYVCRLVPVLRWFVGVPATCRCSIMPVICWLPYTSLPLGIHAMHALRLCTALEALLPQAWFVDPDGDACDLETTTCLWCLFLYRWVPCHLAPPATHAYLPACPECLLLLGRYTAIAWGNDDRCLVGAVEEVQWCVLPF